MHIIRKLLTCSYADVPFMAILIFWELFIFVTGEIIEVMETVEYESETCMKSSVNITSILW
jgi:hypothetical protein